MASLYRKNGLGRIQFSLKDNGRRAIYLGRCTQREGEEVLRHVERLVFCRTADVEMDTHTARWLARIEPDFHDKLVNAGLVAESTQHKRSESMTLDDFMQKYIETFGPTKKPATVTTWRQARRLAGEFFSHQTKLSDVTVGRAVEFRNFLLTRPKCRGEGVLSESTVRRRCGCLSQMFNHAVDLKLSEENPFAGKQIPKTLPKPAPKHFVTHENALEILNHLPHDEFRLLFGLARWGGLRVGSEPQGQRALWVK